MIVLVALFASGYLFSGCAKVEFVEVPPEHCTQMNQAYGSNACVSGPTGTRLYDYTVATGDVDILFVDDNSGSMYTEQVKMANQFPGFLDSIHKLSYHIAITSTDVAGTQSGQDGRFFPFSMGESVLKNSSRVKDGTHSTNITKFQNTIKRNETLDCPNGPACPSGDERGIYAAIRSLQRAENYDFFRPTGHLAIVVLSDEDERSSGGGAPGSAINGGPISQNYLAQENDRPETLVSVAKSRLSPTKSVSVHSIIIRPGDTACHNAQNAQGGGVRGYYGTQYALLSNPSAQLLGQGPLRVGTLGSICSSNYTAEMGQIAQYLTTSQLQLPCTPVSGSLRVDYLDAVPGNPTNTLDSLNQIKFNPALPAGSRVRLQFTCS